MDLTLRRARLAVTITFITNGFTAGTFVARIPDFKRILEISNGTLGSSLLFVSIGALTGRTEGKKNADRNEEQ